MSEQNERTKITVTINKRSYTIVGTEPKEHVELVAKLVNEKMEEIYRANKHLDSTSLAVLTAINTMNDYVKLTDEHEKLKEEHENVKDVLEKLQEEHKTLKEEYEELLSLLEEES